MVNRWEFHPELRSYPDDFLSQRSSWLNFFWPAEERIAWYGDVRLRCRKQDYQSVLDVVPGAVTVGEGEDRTTAPNWGGLDDYRLAVAAWLAGFDESGRPLKGKAKKEPVVLQKPVRKWFRRGG